MIKYKYNLDKLIKVNIHDFRKSIIYTYRKSKKFCGIKICKEGFYGYDMYFKKLPSNHILKDNIVYELPNVVLIFQDEYRFVTYCNSYAEARALADKFTNTKKWIEIDDHDRISKL